MALQIMKEFNLDTWVVFVDLVKASDTVNGDMLMKILARLSTYNRKGKDIFTLDVKSKGTNNQPSRQVMPGKDIKQTE